jgi:glutaredoxin
MQSEPLKIYWQPGCSSCLRAKEFLTRHGVDFVSINVLQDSDGFRELAALGLRRVPIVRRGSEWVDGQILDDVARMAGVSWNKPKLLSPAELRERIAIVLGVTQAIFDKIPENKLATAFEERPTTYREVAYHIVRIVETFLDFVEHGRKLEYRDYNREIPKDICTKEDIAQFSANVAKRFFAWSCAAGKTLDYSANADVYYGKQSLHEFLERTTWHSAQHTRQLQYVAERLGLQPCRVLTPEDIADLPIPKAVWDGAG